MSNSFLYPENEDNALFLLIRERDKQAFTVVYQKYHAYLYALALRYLKNTEMAQDAVQHVFVKLWENTAKMEIEINLKNYLYTMTKNYIINQIRDRKEVVSLNYVHAQTEISDSDWFETVDEMELSDVLREGIDKLPPQKREVCKMKIEGEVSNQDIAENMGVSVHTVKSHYQESVKMLRSYFRKIKWMMF